MKKTQGRALAQHLATFALFFLISGLALPFASLAFGQAAAAAAPQSPLNVIGAQWSFGSAQPGDNDAALNVTIQNLNSYSIFGVTEVMNLSTVSSDLLNSTNGVTAKSYIPSGSVPMGGTGSATFRLNIPQANHVVNPIRVPMTVYYLNLTGSLVSQSLTVPVFLTQATGLTIAGAEWYNSNGVQGDPSDQMQVNVLNTNPFPIHSLSGTLHLNIDDFVSTTGKESVANEPGAMQTIPAKSLGALYFLVDVEPSAGIGAVSLTVSLGYQDQWGLVLNQSSLISINVFGFTSVSAVATHQTVSLNGQPSPVSFQVNNTGTAPIYSPRFVLSVPSPLTIASNSTFRAPALVLYPGQSVDYLASISAGPSAGLGAYSGTLTVTFTDQFGVSRSVNFATSFVVSGTTILHLEGVQITQSYGNVTVAGNIVDNGTSPASYMVINGTIGSVGSSQSAPLGTGSQYIGTVSPKTPSFFTFTIPVTSPSSSAPAKISFVMDYQNAQGQKQASSANTPFVLESASQLKPSSNPQYTVVLYALIAVVIVVVLVSFLYLRSSRRQRRSST